MVRARAVIVAVLILGAPAAWADRLVFIAAPPSVGLGGVSSAFTVERQLDTGAPITTGTLTVTLASSSARGQFGADPAVSAPWTAGLTMGIGAGQSSTAPIYYRDGAHGLANLTAQAPASTSAATTVAVGNTILVDSAESGSLYVTDIPPGEWNANWLPEPGNTLGPAAAAAHRGSWGVRLDDAIAMNGSGGQNAVFFDTAPIVGDLYVRTWMRVTVGTTNGNIVVAQLTTDSGTTDAGPPVFLTLPPSSAVCDQPIDYRPEVDSPGPIAWTLGSGDAGLPDGLVFDPQTGRVQWTPSKIQFGPWRADLRAQAAGGSTTQTLEVNVTCPTTRYEAGCGCGSVELTPLLFGLLFAVTRRGKRHRLA